MLSIGLNRSREVLRENGCCFWWKRYAKILRIINKKSIAKSDSIAKKIPYHTSKGGPRGVKRGRLPPRLLEKKSLKQVYYELFFVLCPNKKKTPTLIHVQTLNTKKVGKKIFSNIPNHITFSPNILFILVLSHHICLHPFYCSFFQKKLFSIYYSQHFSCGTMI